MALPSVWPLPSLRPALHLAARDRRLGPFQLAPHPSLGAPSRQLKDYATPPGRCRKPESHSTKSATRGAVHNPVSYPSPSVPRSSSYLKRRHLSALRRDLRPARPGFFSATRSLRSTRSAEQYNVCLRMLSS